MCNDDKAAQNSLLQLPNYAPIHQIRDNHYRVGWGDVAGYVHNSLDFKISRKVIYKNHETHLFLVWDLNINSLDYSINTTVCNFFLAFQNGFFSLINRPTGITKSSATIIDHMLTNTIIDSEGQSCIIKTDISDHFAVFALMKTSLILSNIKKTFIKRDIKVVSIQYIKSILNSVDCNLITEISTPNSSYNIFKYR